MLDFLKKAPFISNLVQNKKDISMMNQQSTLQNKNAYSIDRNNDGIPDYLNRPDIPSIVKSIADTTLAHKDPQREIEKILMNWRGYGYDSDKMNWIPKSPPRMTEEGVRVLGELLDEAINKLTIDGNIPYDWCHKMAEMYAKTASELLEDNQKLWQIRDSDLSPICRGIDFVIFQILSRSVDDGQRNHDTQRLKITSDNAPKQNASPI
jgi:hypothetical protein